MPDPVFVSNAPMFWVLAAFAFLIVGISKGGFGGLAIVAVPIMSLQISPITAAAIALPVLCAMDWVALYTFWGKWDKPIMKLVIPGTVIGIAIGGFIFTSLSVDAVKLIVGLIAIAFVLHYWLTSAMQWQLKKPGRPLGFLLAIATGFTSHIAHAGAPPYSMYVLPQRLPKEIYVGTMVVVFTIINLVKLVPYTLSGQFNSQVIYTALVLLPIAPVGVFIGKRLLGKVNDQLFYRITYALVFIVGLKLLYDVLV